jgi:hypothetical protein
LIWWFAPIICTHGIHFEMPKQCAHPRFIGQTFREAGAQAMGKPFHIKSASSSTRPAYYHPDYIAVISTKHTPASLTQHFGALYLDPLCLGWFLNFYLYEELVLNPAF